MSTIERFKPAIALALLTSLNSSIAFAHPGHLIDSSVHSLLHVEHIIALVAAGVVGSAFYLLRRK